MIKWSMLKSIRKVSSFFPHIVWSGRYAPFKAIKNGQAINITFLNGNIECYLFYEEDEFITFVYQCLDKVKGEVYSKHTYLAFW